MSAPTPKTPQSGKNADELENRNITVNAFVPGGALFLLLFSFFHLYL
jgi:hypothetical protein